MPLQESRQKAASALTAILVKDQRDFEAAGRMQSGGEDAFDKAHDVDRALRRCSPLMVHYFGLVDNRWTVASGPRASILLTAAAGVCGKAPVSRIGVEPAWRTPGI